MMVFRALAKDDRADPWMDPSSEIPLDPVARMKKLWEQEMQEAIKNFKDDLRESGVNVEEWEEKFDSWDGKQSPHEVFKDTIGNGYQHKEL